MTEAQLVESWIASIDDVALAFAHEPDAKVDASLGRMRNNLSAEFLRVFPKADPATMEAGVDSIVVAIQKRRREIEAGGAVPAQMN
jgi:hypothetical protein